MAKDGGKHLVFGEFTDVLLGAVSKSSSRGGDDSHFVEMNGTTEVIARKLERTSAAVHACHAQDQAFERAGPWMGRHGFETEEKHKDDWTKDPDERPGRKTRTRDQDERTPAFKHEK
ncbi:MAG: hypothetical protein GY885_09850 [Phycisphaeraceae bacterium]|nr:hypothetical protein [Phycisphaeraceae bacterium]